MSSSSSFEEAVQFALERLHKEDLDPREEHLQSIKAVIRWTERVCVPTNMIWKKVFVKYQAIPFVMDFKLGRAGTSKTRAILVVFPIVSLIVTGLTRRRLQSSLLAVIWP